jgi:hypothetical protein
MRRTWLWVLIAAVAALLVPAIANGALSASTSLPTSAGATRIVVTVNGVGTVPKRQRPIAVSVAAGGARYTLAKVNNRRWRSAKLKPAAVTKLRALKGTRVTVRVKSTAGTRSLRSVLRVPASTGGTLTPPPTTPPPTTTPPGTPPLFEAPASNLIGNDAFNHISRYFLNARFTDCPGLWPTCAVEQRYNHCADGSWEYYRLTPSSGSDIKSFGSFQVTGAAANTDGSWGVEYLLTAYSQQSFYSWNVAANGTVTGSYWAPGNLPPNPPSESLGPMVWQGPITCTGSPY